MVNLKSPVESKKSPLRKVSDLEPNYFIPHPRCRGFIIRDVFNIA